MFLNLDVIRFNFLPWFYRTNKNNATIDAYCHSLEEVNSKDSEMNVLRDQVIYSAEKINLEAYCNDIYDNALRRIFIGQTVNPNDVFLGLDVESPTGEIFLGLDSESPTGEVFLGLDSEFGGPNIVVVNVPSALSAQNDLIKQGVENYVRIPSVVQIVNF